VLLALTLGAWLALGSGSALATVQHNFEFSFNGSNTAGVVTRTADVAFDQASGNVWVLDSSGQAVDQFAPDGTYAGVRFTGASTPATAFSLTVRSGVTVDNSGGANTTDVYVADTGHHVVDRFDAHGNYLCQITGSATPSATECNGASGSLVPAGSMTPTGMAVTASGDVYVADRANNVIDEFNPSGGYIGQISDPHITFPVRLALDSSGDLYVANGNSTGTVEFDATGGFIHVVDGGSATNSVAVDPASGHVYVAETHPSGVQISEFDAAGNRIDSFGSAQFGAHTVDGIAVRPSTGEVYAADFNADQVDVFTQPLIFPDVTTGQASNVQTTSATLTGTVNPSGAPLTDCHFDYGTSSSYGQSAACVPDAVSIGSGTSPVPVHADVSGLQPSTLYHFRLVAANAQETSSGPDQILDTLGPPTIAAQPANSISTTGATLFAAINPRGFDTTYHFEYGTTTGYGLSSSSASLAAGTDDQVASAQISGLAADTTYHFRAVAANSQGTATGPDYTLTTAPASCPNAQFRVGPSALLPDCRAYEQVSPEDKGGFPVDAPTGNEVGGQPPQAPSGDRVAFSSLGAFAGAQSSPVGIAYLAQRTASGWTTAATAPPPSLGSPGGGAESLAPIFSSDLGLAAYTLAPGDKFATPTSAALFLRAPDGSFAQASPTITRLDGGNPLVDVNLTTVGTSPDLSHVFLGSIYPLIASDTGPSPSGRIYEVAGVGGPSPALRLLTVDSGGHPIDACGSLITPLIGGPGDSGETHPISQDGATVFFTTLDAAAGCLARVYARVDGQRTVSISDPSPNNACTTPACTGASPGPATFAGASADGSKAFFMSTQQLTDGASQDPVAGDGAHGAGDLGCGETQGANGCNLYMYDSGRPAGDNLIDLSGGDSSGLGPRVKAVLGVSDDGSHVYFVAQGALTSQPNSLGQSARPGAENVYVYNTSAGAVSFVAVLCTGSGQSGTRSDAPQCTGDDGPLLGLGGGVFPDRSAVSPDGRYFAFTTYAQLTPDDQNHAADVYEYDAQTGSLVRASVGHDGQDQNGNAGAQDAVLANSTTSGQAWQSDTVRSMSADGQTIVFFTARSLQNGANNGAVDVYEWHGGEVSLVSGAHSDQDIENAAITPSGNDIMFTTDEGLVPQDTDGLLDVYDARVGGGFPAPPAPTAPCTGDGCQGQPAGAPASPVAATVSFSGPGNAIPRSSPASGRPRVLTRTVRGSRFTLIVSVPGAGRLRIGGAGIKPLSRALGAAGSYRLRISLTAKETKALRRRHRLRLRLRLRVSYAPTVGRASSATVRLTVKA
jgi:sugar lactone lactonase YvrE